MNSSGFARKPKVESQTVPKTILSPKLFSLLFPSVFVGRRPQKLTFLKEKNSN